MDTTPPAGPAQSLLDVATVYHEPAVPAHARGREILDRFLDAEQIVVPSTPCSQADATSLSRQQ